MPAAAAARANPMASPVWVIVMAVTRSTGESANTATFSAWWLCLCRRHQ
jgi:hypothetical protein